MADFASLMAAAMSKSKPATTTSTETQNKYLKRSELEAQREAEYRAEKEAAEKARQEKASQKRKFDEEEAIRAVARDEKRRRLAEESRQRREEEEAAEESRRRKRLGLPPLPPKAIEGAEGGALPNGLEDIPDEELIAKLRAMGEPAILFAETHLARLKRHKALITPKPKLTTGPIPTTLELLPEADMAVPAKVPPVGPERDYLFRQLASYFTMVLTEWQRALGERPDAVKESSQGRQAEGAWVQSRENMRPLFKRFEKGELEEGILEPVVEIVRAAQQRRYVDANDGYLQLSIGKA